MISKNIIIILIVIKYKKLLNFIVIVIGDNFFLPNRVRHIAGESICIAILDIVERNLQLLKKRIKEY